MIRYYFTLMVILLAMSLNAQKLNIVQENDDILIFNESDQTVEVWVGLEDEAVNEILSPGIMKKYINESFFRQRDIDDSEIFVAYTYNALAYDIEKSLKDFYQRLDENRGVLNRGYKKVNKPFYRTKVFSEFLEKPEEKNNLKKLSPKHLEDFVKRDIVPYDKKLFSKVAPIGQSYQDKVVQMISKFLAMTVIDERELSMFLMQMNNLETMFNHYANTENEINALGSLADNGFKFFERKGNPGTNLGVFITTNNLKLIKDYNYREMETRGLNFDVAFSQRLYVARVAKRRTFNLYGALNYLSLKDKEYDLKKSFINVGPQIRYAGFYENQLELILEGGATIDITADKYMVPEDNKQFGYYAGGQLSLLFFRFGMRYYDQLTEPDLSPEGQWFYRLGLVAKF